MSEPRTMSAMAVRPRFTGDETVDQVLRQHPELGPALMAFGLCTCCSGSLTLRQNAEAHGVSLAALLHDLNEELAKSA